MLAHNGFLDTLVDMFHSGTLGDACNPKYLKGVSENSKDARKLAAKVATELIVIRKTRVEREVVEEDST
jgi:hypothetical protein